MWFVICGGGWLGLIRETVICYLKMASPILQPVDQKHVYKSTPDAV